MSTLFFFLCIFFFSVSPNTYSQLHVLSSSSYSEPQPSRPLGEAPASYSSQAALAKRHPERAPARAETSDPDDPAIEGTNHANEDVLSQLRRSLHIEEFGCDKAASDAQNEETDGRQSEETVDEENKRAGKDEEHEGQEDKSTERNASLTEAGEYLARVGLAWGPSGHALADSCH